MTRNGKGVICHWSRNRSSCEANFGAWTSGRARLEAVKTRVGNRVPGKTGLSRLMGLCHQV